MYDAGDGQAGGRIVTERWTLDARPSRQAQRGLYSP